MRMRTYASVTFHFEITDGDELVRIAREQAAERGNDDVENMIPDGDYGEALRWLCDQGFGHAGADILDSTAEVSHVE
jgi:hypothetical protein